MPKRLLLVDDDLNILESARDILEDNGYQVATASTVQHALECLHAGPADVLIVDFNLPDGNGIALSRDARRLVPALKVILMTGDDAIDVSGAAGVISVSLLKPVAPPMLLATLQRLLTVL